jgi:hypothetical protein
MVTNYSVRRTGWGLWIDYLDNTIAGVIRGNYSPKSVEFFTPPELGLQVAMMNRPESHEIPAHFHLPVPRSLVGTQEVLVIQIGSLRADLYSDEQDYLCSVVLNSGDIIILNSGGHGFKASSDCRFVEIKQGPYIVGKDKFIFSEFAIPDSETKVES